MIRLLRCLRKRDDITDMEFRQFWQAQEYREIIDTCVSHSEGVSFQMNLVLKIDLNDEIKKTRGTDIEFDATVEIFWPSAKDSMDFFLTSQGQDLVAKLQAYESQFVDFTRSSISMTESS